jgi:hypothetical protein
MRNLAGQPALPDDVLLEYFKSIWLPATTTRKWLGSRQRPIPSWLVASNGQGVAESSGARAPTKAGAAVSSNDTGELAKKWMLTLSENQSAKPKREQSSKDCMKETGCTYREARAAWMALPIERKRRPRQTDRALRKQTG